MPDSPPTIARVEVEALDRQGAGRARLRDAAISIAGALPGETVDVALHQPKQRDAPLDGELRAVLTASADRVEPPCPHFGRCGGCALQHLAEPAYLAWKKGRIAAELRRHGVLVPDERIGEWIRSPPGSRRRIDLTIQRIESGCRIGLNERASHRVVDIEACPILSSTLFGLISPLRAAMTAALPMNGRAEAVMNEVDGNVDLLIVPEQRATVSKAVRTAMSTLAQNRSIARVSWGRRGDAETLAQSRPVRLSSLGVPVDLPPGAFLQASVPAEQAMQALMRRWGEGARRAVDLYAGIGTLSLPLLGTSRVDLFEADASAVAAVDAGLRRAALLGRGTATRRNLAQDPLQPDELERFDLAILDPPRAGALPQVAQIAASTLGRVAMVSCNPDTFARDARVLIDAGFELLELVPIDQFLWSPHIELAASFARKRKRRSS